MDELTPIEPEYRELPPEQPPQTPDYYGTGVQPQQKKSKLPLVLTLLTILMAANLATVAVSLFIKRDAAEVSPPEDDHLLPIYEDDYPQEHDKKNPHLQIGMSNSAMLKEIYEHYAPGMVAITVRTEDELHCATGVILTQDGYVLTDAEIFEEPSHLEVTLYDGTHCDAAFIGMDSNSEMAILKINAQGLDTVMLSEDAGRQAYQILQEFLENIARPASLNLDISEVPKPMQIYWGLPEGVIINRIMTASNAYRAGLRPGDVLLQIGEIRLSSVGDYIEALSSYSAGETVRIYLFREGATYYTDICLEAEE